MHPQGRWLPGGERHERIIEQHRHLRAIPELKYLFSKTKFLHNHNHNSATLTWLRMRLGISLSGAVINGNPKSNTRRASLCLISRANALAPSACVHWSVSISSTHP